MTTTVHAYAALDAGGRLEPYEHKLGRLGPDEVDLDVKSCGICFSDVSMIDNAWGFTPYPLVPGHEIVGMVRATGERVSHLAVGDVVGLGWNAGSCLVCAQCMSGDHHMCAKAVSTSNNAMASLAWATTVWYVAATCAASTAIWCWC